MKLFPALSAAIFTTVAACGLSYAAHVPPMCFSTHSTGLGPEMMKICLSANGNLLHFESPEAYQVVGAGDGYVVCSDEGTIVHGADGAGSEIGFDAPVITQPNGPNTFPITITRTTTDGIFRLQQTFSRDRAEKDLTITMKLTNISPARVSGVRLVRYYGAKNILDQAGEYITEYRWARTADSVWGYEDGSDRHGLTLSALDFAMPHETSVENYLDWEALTWGACDAEARSTPTKKGDYVGRVNYGVGTIRPGKSKTVKFVYGRL